MHLHDIVLYKFAILFYSILFLMEGRMLGKATRERKRLEMLSDITSNDFESSK